MQKAALALFQTFLPLQLSQLWPDLINTILRIVNPSLLDSTPVVDASPRSHRTGLSSFSMERVVDLLLQLYRFVQPSRHSRIKTRHKARREAVSSRSGGCKLLVHQDHLQAVAISPYLWLDLMSGYIQHQHVHHALHMKKVPCANVGHVPNKDLCIHEAVRGHDRAKCNALDQDITSKLHICLSVSLLCVARNEYGL